MPVQFTLLIFPQNNNTVIFVYDLVIFTAPYVYSNSNCWLSYSFFLWRPQRRVRLKLLIFQLYYFFFPLVYWYILFVNLIKHWIVISFFRMVFVRLKFIKLISHSTIFFSRLFLNENLIPKIPLNWNTFSFSLFRFVVKIPKFLTFALNSPNRSSYYSNYLNFNLLFFHGYFIEFQNISKEWSNIIHLMN